MPPTPECPTDVTTGRKPKTGLKHGVVARASATDTGHDGEKTQDGIETKESPEKGAVTYTVTTGRKPKTGLKLSGITTVNGR